MTHPTPTRDLRLDRAIDALRAARFHVRRKGFDIPEVDDLLQRCLDGLEAASSAAPSDDDRDEAWHEFWGEAGGTDERSGARAVVALIEGSKLRARRKGYDPDEVTDLLAELTAILTGPQLDRAPAAGSPVPDPVASEPSTPAPAPIAAPTLATGTAPARPGPSAQQAPAPTAAPPEPVQPPSAVGVVEPAGGLLAPDLEDQLVREVLDASLRGAREAAQVAGLRRETERLALLRMQADLAEIDERMARRQEELRIAALEQCEDIVAAARAEAERTLAAVTARVDEQLQQLRVDATAELERIIVDEQLEAAAIAGALAPEGGPVELPRRPRPSEANGAAWDRCSVERHGPSPEPLSTNERVATDGGAPTAEEH